MSQLLFNGTVSSPTNYVLYNQTLVLDDQFEIDQSKVAANGLPSLTGTYLGYIVTSNMGLAAALTHMLLWNRSDIRQAWAFASLANLNKLANARTWMFWKNDETPEERLARKESDDALDPHYKLMLRNKYRECPQWWWFTVFVLAWAVGLGCLYAMKVCLRRES